MTFVQDIADEVEWVEGDILDYDLLEDILENIDNIIHAAALVSMEPGMRKKMMRVNAEGTANLVNAALEKKVQRFVHISSIAAIGRSPKKRVIDEQYNWERTHMNTNYAVSKFFAEQEVWRGIAEGLPAAILNPAVVLGSSDWGKNTGQFFQRVAQGLQYYPAGYSGFVDVRDVAALAVRLLHSDICGERYIASSENMSYKTLLSMIAQAMSKKPPARKLTPVLRNVIWRGAWLLSKLNRQPPLLTRESAMVSSLEFEYTNKKSIQELQHTYIPIAQTVEDTVRLFMKMKDEGRCKYLTV